MEYKRIAPFILAGVALFSGVVLLRASAEAQQGSGDLAATRPSAEDQAALLQAQIAELLALKQELLRTRAARPQVGIHQLTILDAFGKAGANSPSWAGWSDVSTNDHKQQSIKVLSKRVAFEQAFPEPPKVVAALAGVFRAVNAARENTYLNVGATEVAADGFTLVLSFRQDGIEGAIHSVSMVWVAVPAE